MIHVLLDWRSKITKLIGRIYQTASIQYLPSVSSASYTVYAVPGPGAQATETELVTLIPSFELC